MGRGFLNVLIVWAMVALQLGTVRGQDAKSVPQTEPPELIFEGVKSVSPSDLVAAFKTCSQGAWKTYEPRAYEYYSQTCARRYLWSQGFLKATVSEKSVELAESRYTVIFAVTEGPRFRWGEIVVKDLKPEFTLLFSKWLGIRRGEIANGQQLQEIVYSKLIEEYSERGYIQAIPAFDLLLTDSVPSSSDGVADVTIRIDEGRRFMIRRIEFQGVPLAENEKLVSEFPLKRNALFVRSKLGEGIDAINRSGKYRHLDRDSDVQLLVDEESTEVDVIILVGKPGK